MASLLKSIDIYSTKFNFTIEKESAYSTLIGTILTILTGIIFVALFIILGKDFLYKENARTSTSALVANDFELFSPRDLNLTIAISLAKGKVKQLDLNGGFFWSDFTYTYQYWNETANAMSSSIAYIPLKNCTNLTYQPAIDFGDKFQCLEFPIGAKFGAQGNDSHSLLYSLFNCAKKYPMNIPGAKCNTLETLRKTFKEENTISYMFQVYYPVLYYDPRDKVQPAKVNYDLLSFPFDFNLQRADILNFHKTVVNEDKGWWFEENHNETFWTIESRDYYFNYRSDADLSAMMASSKFYQLTFEMSLKNNYYTRSYMKIQDVLAVVATILKILVIVFETLCMFINGPLMKYHILTQLFNTFRSNSKSNITVYSNNNVSKFQLVNASKTKDCPPSTLMRSGITPLSPINKKSFATKSRRNAFNKCFAFKRSIGSFLFSKKDKPLVEKFDQGSEIVNEKIDIDHYVKMIYDIIILQKSIYNEAQFYSLNHLKKVNIFDPQEVEAYFYPKKGNDNALQKYSGYFSNQVDKGENGESKDRFLLGMMNDSFKSKIYSKKISDLG